MKCAVAECPNEVDSDHLTYCGTCMERLEADEAGDKLLDRSELRAQQVRRLKMADLGHVELKLSRDELAHQKKQHNELLLELRVHNDLMRAHVELVSGLLEEFRRYNSLVHTQESRIERALKDLTAALDVQTKKESES